ncbi:MAG: hypothetical protein WC492_01595 [Candidatus Micrarchaeia archaeon]
MTILDRVQNIAFKTSKYPTLCCDIIKRTKDKNYSRPRAFNEIIPVLDISYNDKIGKTYDFNVAYKSILNGVAEINKNYLSDYNSVIVSSIISAIDYYLKNSSLERLYHESDRLTNLTTLKNGEWPENGFRSFLIDIKDDIKEKVIKKFGEISLDRAKKWNAFNDIMRLSELDTSKKLDIICSNESISSPNIEAQRSMIATDIAIYFAVAIPRLKTIYIEYNENSYGDKVFSFSLSCLETIYASLYINFDVAKEIYPPSQLY